MVFDLDGVLLDSESDLSWLNRALKEALNELGVPPTEENVEKLYPGGLRDLEEAVNGFPASPAEVWEVRDKYYIAEKVKAIEAGRLRPFPDVKHLEKLGDHYSLGIISNSPSEVVDCFLRKYGLIDLFHTWVGRGSGLDELKRIKPDPHPFWKLDRKMGNGDYWYIGDRETDAEFAKKTGMNFLHLTRDGDGFTDLEEVVHYLL